jgi:SelR domain
MRNVLEASFNLRPPTQKQMRELVADLSEEERHLLLEHGEEAPFCGVFLHEKREGFYTCRLCGLPLFKAGAKFESGTGWPSYTGARRSSSSPIHSRYPLWHGEDGDRLRSLRRAPRSRLSRRPASNRGAFLRKFRIA